MKIDFENKAKAGNHVTNMEYYGMTNHIANPLKSHVKYDQNNKRKYEIRILFTASAVNNCYTVFILI